MEENVTRIIIDGNGYDFDYDNLKNIVDAVIEAKNFTNITTVIGSDKGIGNLGEKYALEKGYPIRYFYPNWNKLGPKAGYYRNCDMINFISKAPNSLLIYFLDEKSKKTRKLISIAKKKNIEMVICKYN